MSQERVVLLGSRQLALAEGFRVLTPEQPPTDADALAEFIARSADGPVHVVAESSMAGVGCWLAIRFPNLVGRLVLARPACPGEDLIERLGEIQAETLLVFDSTADPEHGHVYQQRIPRAYRFFVYAQGRLVGLVTDFLRRGETFIVNTGETRS
jgi:pimeloyl-ACP methyl ester carboxylesterase